jgi:transcriptional regulator with XRE-family HTH domain
MPERSFGRTVRYRRTKLGLSQTRLADLVGRSPSTIRSWESDRSTPNDPGVLFTLAAILGTDERMLFDKAGVEMPIVMETTPTMEQALASLAPEADVETDASEEPSFEDRSFDPIPVPTPPEVMRRLRPRPVPEPTTSTVTTLVAVPAEELSYMEDPGQRQMYRVRTLASVVGLVALAVTLLWAAGEGLQSLGEWWNEFFSGLRL